MINISAIICTYNRYKYLPKAISSLLEQTIPKEDYEILIIDNCSTDDTRQIVEDFQTKYDHIRYFYEETQGLSAARNRGIKEARGGLIAFLDDDAVASYEWLDEFLKAFNNFQNAGCAGGKIELLWPDGQKPDWLNSKYESFFGKLNLGDKIRPFIFPETPFGGNLCIRKDIAYSLGFFDENLGRNKDCLLSGEEVGFVYKVQKVKESIYIPTAKIYHHVLPDRINKKYLLDRMYWQGVSSMKFEIIYRSIDKFSLFKNIFSNFKNVLYYIGKSSFEDKLNYQYNKGRLSQGIKYLMHFYYPKSLLKSR